MRKKNKNHNNRAGCAGTLYSDYKSGDTTFDGSWTVTVDAKVYINPDGSKAQPVIWHLPATVKNGFFHGEVETKSKPFWYELSGQIESGTATLHADELTGEQKCNFSLSQKAPPGKGYAYSYNGVAHFNG